MLLARDVRQRRLALGVERVELHVEALVGGDAGVDGAADLADGRLHLPLRWVRKPKKGRAIPARAGDRAGDRRQRLVSPALILEAVVEHGGGVLHALPLADQPGAGDRAVTLAHRQLALDPPILLLDQLLQLRLGARREPAVGQFLDPIGEPLHQERLVVGRRLAVVEVAPELFELAAWISPVAPPVALTHCPSWPFSVVFAFRPWTALVGGEVQGKVSAVAGCGADPLPSIQVEPSARRYATQSSPASIETPGTRSGMNRWKGQPRRCSPEDNARSQRSQIHPASTGVECRHVRQFSRPVVRRGNGHGARTDGTATTPDLPRSLPAGVARRSPASLWRGDAAPPADRRAPARCEFRRCPCRRRRTWRG